MNGLRMVDNNGRKSLMKKEEVKREVVNGSVEASLNVIEIPYHLMALLLVPDDGL
jgi:hypothetical protein